MVINSSKKDALIWRRIAIGEFSVYHMEKERQDLVRGDSSTQLRGSDIWRIIWQLTIPNATRMFLWRACHNLLPTKDNLVKKGIVKEASYPICTLEDESTNHIIWSCPSVMNVWGECGKKI